MESALTRRLTPGNFMLAGNRLESASHSGSRSRRVVSPVALYPLIGVRHGLGVSWANLPGGRRSVYSGFASPLRAAWPVNPCPVGGASMLGPRSGARPNDTVIGWGTAYVTRSCWQRGQYSERED